MADLIPLTVMLLNNLAFCQFNLKNYEEAIKYTRETLLVDPTNVKAYYRTALSYKKLGDF